ncbi:MAG TPA: hypothetical protein VN493_25670 [Thermoanaerobaculia bacterium]|nr:hypothetical protein [Thermoanaerobaculia bacterium]
MGLNLSVGQMLAQLEGKVAHHRERQAFHAEQEVLHRDKQAHHAAALETALAHLQSFQAAATAAGDLLDLDKTAALPEPDADVEFARKRSLSRMIARVLEGRASDATFGARSVAQEIQERWGARLRRRVDPRSVAATLRRWAVSGRIHQVREGRAHYEALYRKTPPAAAPE